MGRAGSTAQVAPPASIGRDPRGVELLTLGRDRRDPRHDAVIKTNGYPGPTAVLPGGGPDAILFLAGGICAGYTKAPTDKSVSVQVSLAGQVRNITVLPILPHEARRFLIK